MKRKLLAMFTGLAISTLAFSTNVAAAVPKSALTKKYDKISNMTEKLDSYDITIKETTIIPDIQSNAVKDIHLMVSGLEDLDDLQVNIRTKTDEGIKHQYYLDGYYYTDENGSKSKYRMKPEEMLEILNNYVYLDLNSSLLESLDKKNNTYTYTATSSTLGDLLDHTLEGVQNEHKVRLLALQGNTTVDDHNNITRRRIQTVYTIYSGDEPTTCTVNSVSTFHDPGTPVTVTYPSLKAYADKTLKDNIVEVTKEVKTVYATADLNVRAANDVSSAVLGGIPAGGEIRQVGKTSDGWIKIDYNGTPAYVSADYVTDTKPVITTPMSGTMYATTIVNIRDKASSEGTLLGGLNAGDPIVVTGYTNNNWIRVKYKNQTAYICRDYLTWDSPVTAMGGIMFVAGELANVRSFQSTDGDILGTLTQGDTVSVTGYTGNNWIRVNYNGKTGYIYANLLSWEDPLASAKDDSDDSKTKPEKVTYDIKQTYGVVTNLGINTITVACNNGKTLVLDRSDADINCPTSGLHNGLYASIVYEAGSDGSKRLMLIEEM